MYLCVSGRRFTSAGYLVSTSPRPPEADLVLVIFIIIIIFIIIDFRHNAFTTKESTKAITKQTRSVIICEQPCNLLAGKFTQSIPHFHLHIVHFNSLHMYDPFFPTNGFYCISELKPLNPDKISIIGIFFCRFFNCRVLAKRLVFAFAISPANYLEIALIL